MRTAVARLALLAIVLVAPVRANDLPPDVSIKGDYAKITMFMSGHVLRNRELAENCRQETRDWAKSIEADERSKASAPPQEVPSFGRRYDLFTIVGNGRYSSVLRMSATEIDDVYNAIENTTLLWDSKETKRIDLSRFFGETKDGGPAMIRLFAEATEGLVGKIGKDKAAELIGTLRPSLDGIGPISLTPSTVDGKSSGLDFHYAIAVPGQFHLSHVVVFVPWTKFKRHLSPQGRTIFGGKWRYRYLW